jgi:hypothetical protein
MSAERKLRRGGIVGATAALARVGNAPQRDNSVKAQRAQRCLTEVVPTLAYKPRPLNGIWFTAPSLPFRSVGPGPLADIPSSPRH